MGSWRLRSRTSPALSVTLAQIEQSWRDQIEDLTLVPLPPFARLVDSCDPARKTAYSHAEVPDPARDAPRYPRVLAEARAYRSGLFARLLIWLVLVQDGSQILHVHMLPSGARDLGVVSLDLAADPSGHLSAATIDVCPVGWPRRLPGAYSQALQNLQRQWALPKPAQAPEWTTKTGSHLCYHARGLSREEDVGAVIKYAVALVRYQAHVARLVTALPAGDARRRAVLEAQKSLYQTRLHNGDGREAVEGCLAGQEMQEYLSVLFPMSVIV
ncbi:hypothetical protein H632_c2269p0 [Helicosporidium sp. ATCC 50920]|nr:hypothetical protein H632_c2269p0 [Helicosporidium sp. ATCC 50920]|eukprot:KDD73346.1 hypothetical protein H632_c2269p0 [Helicosporidium sp. ATCC 50920]